MRRFFRHTPYHVDGLVLIPIAAIVLVVVVTAYLSAITQPFTDALGNLALCYLTKGMRYLWELLTCSCAPMS